MTEIELAPEDEDVATEAFLQQLDLLGGVLMMSREEARYRLRVALVAAIGAVRRHRALKAPEAADKLEALSGRISMQDRVIAAACGALDVADALIAVNLGLDTPKRWDDAMRNVAKSRAALAQTQSEG